MTFIMVEGTSEPQDFALKDDGVALNGTSWAIGIEWRGTAPANPPTIAWLNQAAGTVRASGCEDMARGSYPFRFTITDGSGKMAYVPSSPDTAAADLWVVVRV